MSRYRVPIVLIVEASSEKIAAETAQIRCRGVEIASIGTPIMERPAPNPDDTEFHRGYWDAWNYLNDLVKTGGDPVGAAHLGLHQHQDACDQYRYGRALAYRERIEAAQTEARGAPCEVVRLKFGGEG